MTSSQTQNISSVDDLFLKQQRRALALRLEPVAERKKRLIALRQWIHANRSKIQEAAYADFRKPAQEVDAIEIFHVLNELRLALRHLEAWTAPRKIDAPITFLGTRATVKAEPRGVALIISPWNYPFSLAVGPLISALAAGNTAMLKPSELTPHVSAVLSEMARSCFAPEDVTVVEGGVEISQLLLGKPFDHIFFTGSPAVGKIVMKAAAEHLASVTLELGGKSPAFVSEGANIEEAAERIAVGKFVNNGQTCVAPDYVLVHKSLSDLLVRKLIEKTKARFFEGEAGEHSSHYCRIVNNRHFGRLKELVANAKNRGAKIEWAGQDNPATRFMHPVILSSVPSEAALMDAEIFGPVLPVIAYDAIEEAIDFVNGKPKPLALYVFSTSKATQQQIISATSAGAVCVNDCGIHFLHHNLPFGGVNHSGMGKSHGYEGFLTFSNVKPVLRQRSGLTTLKPFYPPYTPMSRKLMDWFLKLF